MKYINADKLITKLENYANNIPASETSIANVVGDIFNIIDSLQQEQSEIVLEKEIEKYCRIYYNCNYPDQIHNGRCSPIMPHIVEAARYFYKLRLATGKENDK